MATNCINWTKADAPLLSIPNFKYCLKITTSTVQELSLGLLGFTFSGVGILTPNPVVLPVKISTIVYTDGTNYYYNNAPGRTVYGIFLKDNNNQLLEIDLDLPEVFGEACFQIEEEVILTEEQIAINCFEGKLQEKQLEFVSDVSNYVKKLNLGNFCCKELNKLIIDKKKLEILNCYDTRDIYNCTPQTITFNEEFYNINYYESGLDDLDIQSGYVQFAVTESHPTIEYPRFQKSYLMYISGKDIHGNDIPEFTYGDIIRLKVETSQGTKWGVYLIDNLNNYWMPSYMEYYITPLDYLSNYYLDTIEDLNNHLILSGTISKVNTISKEYPYILPSGTTPTLDGRFNVSPNYPVNSNNLTYIRLNRNPIEETGSTWLDPVYNLEYPVEIYDTNNNNFYVDYFMLLYMNSDSAPLALYSYFPSSNTHPHYIRFSLNSYNISRGVDAGGIIDDTYNYTVKIITSKTIIIPEKCTQDTTDYNNFTYTEINNLLNS